MTGPLTSDVLVIGAGAFGLCAARAFVEAGADVIVAEASRIGAGASGGPVGVLAPHMAERWNDKKAYQLRALLELDAETAALHAATGLDTGYGRTGRLTPLRTDSQVTRTEALMADARIRWPGHSLAILPPAAGGDWIAPPERGLAHDTLTARIDPLRYLAALAAFIRKHGRLLEGWRWRDAAGAENHFDRGHISAPLTIHATGHAGLTGKPGDPLRGTGVKGQAAVLDLTPPPDAPVLYEEGIYITPHPGHVAVGSTSEADWTAPATTDDRLDQIIATARALCPPLRDAPVTRRWAGVRPKAHSRDPVVALSGEGGARRIDLNGGFRIGLALAQRIGRDALALTRGEASALPGAFLHRKPGCDF